ncbi:ABC transporter, ATP-binding protein [Marvinbryantia formatexigens DSM 14469]|uniref:ABC transporter, ATP-binding protein n=1 Tax=Marvinbryantia formatexigens DSM 14469 TaxID=478749 RepID=C6LLX4_9FIRM|nr:ABC transporter ATP-binding protein [Marvinbryantia formatexigens]EET58384.1 ABC transporter, ATP-binding protein [Marvinbryantia formatexigens DSM 14469]UWO24328.1 ABC transporter ATP-binding protein/permease [Marvinbryantia formatexigens DSM 14469]SDF53842.1 ATP-binding cassette, subfamily B [Marvinbryantia formatexigens]
MKRKESWIGSLLGYAGGQKGKFLGSILLSVISVTAGLVPYYCLYRVIAQFADGTVQRSNIWMWCGAALAAYAVKALFFGLSTGLSHHVAYHVLAGLRLQVADRFLHAPLGEVQRHSIGEIKNIIVDKIEQIEPPLAHVVPEGAGHLALPIVSLLALASVDIRIALASLVTLPAALICMILTFRISGKNFEKYNQSNAYMNSAIVEYIEGIEVIRTFGRAGVSYEKYAGAIRDYRTFVVRWMSSTWVTMKLAFALFPSTLLGTLPVSLYLASRGAITAPQAALAVMLSMSMVTSLAKLEVFSNEIQQMKATVEELQQYLTMPALPEPEKRADVQKYDIQMKDVHFSYGGNMQERECGRSTQKCEENEVLHGINLDLPQGSFTALVGPSGSGKSTVARLLARFWDPDKGQILIGGVDIRDMPLSQLSEYVSFVTQDNYLFRCSLLENIRMGNPQATDEQVKEAARAAQCEEFIRKLPQGYDTPAGEAGKRLSGGEKQRIAIARMILKDAPVVILDEATAFTDPENEDKIQQSIARLAKGKTLLVIAHRLSTIRQADNIVVLENGNILAQGTQEELLKTCPLYRDMWEAHIGAKEWAVPASAENGQAKSPDKQMKKHSGEQKPEKQMKNRSGEQKPVKQTKRNSGGQMPEKRAGENYV